MLKWVRNNLTMDQESVERIAHKYGTPLYLYSRSQIAENYRKFDRAFSSVPHLICYALKANSNLSVARVLSRQGAGTDIVSGGELYRALKAGFDPEKIVFSGVGKTKEEMVYALRVGIFLFNVESIEELRTLDQVAASLKKKAPIAIRVNPDVDVGTHRHITTGTAENKFGIHKNYIEESYRAARSLKHIQIKGIQAHIGSQITSVAPFLTLLKLLLNFVEKLAKNGIPLQTIDVGGGLGISYNEERPPDPKDLAQSFLPLLKNKRWTLLFEPGRFLVGNTGILVTKVLYRKSSSHKTFVIVDAAMNDLARPALYDAYHEIVPLRQRKGEKKVVDVVGPICESGDYLARARTMLFPEKGELLAIKNVGAYGFAMSSQYNSRPRAAEVIVEKNRVSLIRKRETFPDLIHGEK
ncbi:MAG: diaminopimelate decarboxylase [Elusimicrobia bacterium]|nr:diaminopimelate decarboxylase [Elusimicrobiota bacterium]